MNSSGGMGRAALRVRHFPPPPFFLFQYAMWVQVYIVLFLQKPAHRVAHASDGDSSSGGDDDEDDGGGGDGEDDDAPAGRRAVAPPGRAPTDTGKRKRTLGQGLRLGGGGGGGGGRGRT